MLIRFVDGIVTVSEEEILAAMRVMLSATRLVPEPSGAVTLAAALFHADELPKVKKVALVLSGGNLEPELRSSWRGSWQRLRSNGELQRQRQTPSEQDQIDSQPLWSPPKTLSSP